jgi:ubiquinone biosynthesis accessory factor UbiJ
MATQFPFPWLIDEAQQRVILFINHVLMQEPAALERLQRQKGRSIQLVWRDFVFQCVCTPAGLMEWTHPNISSKPDLILQVNEPSPFVLAKSVLQGDKPPIRIEGDVQLAAEVNWLIDHVRWDVEEDLSRIIGDAPAHMVAQNAKKAVDALRSFVLAKMPNTTATKDSV